MKNENKKISQLDQQIQLKLCDNYWDAEIACKVLQIRKDRYKKLVQLGILPIIFMGTTTLIYYSNMHPAKQPDLVHKENIFKNENNAATIQHNHDFFNTKFNYNEHLMNTVFNQSAR